MERTEVLKPRTLADLIRVLHQLFAGGWFDILLLFIANYNPETKVFPKTIKTIIDIPSMVLMGLTGKTCLI